ncbi:MAG: hypothetical protein ACXWJO_00155 [Xanthobacteraceae bacterium]
MRYDWRNNSVLFIHNLDSKPREVSFATGLGNASDKLPVNLLTDDHSRSRDDGRHHLLLEAYGYRWWAGLPAQAPRNQRAARVRLKEARRAPLIS